MCHLMHWTAEWEGDDTSAQPVADLPGASPAQSQHSRVRAKSYPMERPGPSRALLFELADECTPSSVSADHDKPVSHCDCELWLNERVHIGGHLTMMSY